MADKEERIFIFTQQKACDICKKNLEEYDGLTPDCGNCSGKEYPSMTRSEAIEVMAKALCRIATNGECRYSCDTCDFKAQEKVIAEIFPQLEDSFTEQAEASLNALLEGVKK